MDDCDWIRSLVLPSSSLLSSPLFVVLSLALSLPQFPPLVIVGVSWMTWMLWLELLLIVSCICQRMPVERMSCICQRTIESCICQRTIVSCICERMKCWCSLFRHVDDAVVAVVDEASCGVVWERTWDVDLVDKVAAACWRRPRQIRILLMICLRLWFREIMEMIS